MPFKKYDKNDRKFDKNRNCIKISTSWFKEDVQAAAKECDLDELTDNEISDVLLMIKRNDDCTQGITWDSLKIAIDTVLGTG